MKKFNVYQNLGANKVKKIVAFVVEPVQWACKKTRNLKLFKCQERPIFKDKRLLRPAKKFVQLLFQANFICTN